MKLNKSIIIKSVACIATVAMSMGMVSCDDMLDTKPQGVFSEGQITPANYKGLIAAAYAGLANHLQGNNEAFAAPINNWVMDVRADDAYKGGGEMNFEADILSMELGVVNSDIQAVNYKWRNCYYAIARCNTALRFVENNEVPENKESLVCELKTIRAYFWFEMCRCFHKFPYFTEKTANPSEVNINTFTKGQVLAELKKELAEAYLKMPETAVQKGRFNRYVAAALMAKICLWTKDYVQTVQYADYVINCPQYDLYPNFLDMSNPEFNGQYEAVLAVYFSPESMPELYNFNNTLNAPKGIYGDGDGFYVASQNLVNAFRTDANGLPMPDTFNDENVSSASYAGNVDPRLDFTMGRIDMPWRGVSYTKGQAFNYDLWGEHSGKKPFVAPDSPYCETGIVPWGANTLNMLLIRYADVLLWKAEALVEQNLDLQEAQRIVNRIRNRAKDSLNDLDKAMADCNPMLANYKVEPYSGTWNQETARKAVRMERRIELAMEGHRWFDLLRWGIAVETVNAYYASESGLRPWMSGAHLSAENLYFPVPKAQLDNAGDLYK